MVIPGPIQPPKGHVDAFHSVHDQCRAAWKAAGDDYSFAQQDFDLTEGGQRGLQPDYIVYKEGRAQPEDYVMMSHLYALCMFVVVLHHVEDVQRLRGRGATRF